jgi:hypothetical protein
VAESDLEAGLSRAAAKPQTRTAAGFQPVVCIGHTISQFDLGKL